MNTLQQQVGEIIQLMSGRLPQYETDRIRQAYQMAALAHQEQKRKTGEPYIVHPVAVALIVAKELEMGANPVIAAFLHDVVEDTPYTLQQIEERFGKDVAFLVGVVTKQKKEKYDHSKQVDNFRQILTSLEFDIRAVMIKLADRLHNMRTLSSMKPDKQMKIAGETDYFYAPLANRLGLYPVKTELENLSFRYRCPNEYQLISRQIMECQEAERQFVSAFAGRIAQLLADNGIHVRLEIRYRSPYSIWRKMQSKGCDFSHVDRKHYIQLVYEAPETGLEKPLALTIYGLLSEQFKERPGSVANYINAPKENGYQSFHVMLLNEKGGWEEIHISSERMVRNSRLGCNSERTETNGKSWLERFRSVLKDMAYHSREMDFMDGVTATFYNDDIMAFTPKGKVVILPKGATALDFAFEIHSEIGMHALYARINGKLVSVKTVLQRGDCVEIGTSGDVNPDHDWLNHVLTYKAKRHITSYLSSKVHPVYERCAVCHPLPGDEVIGFSRPHGFVIHKRNCPVAIRLASEQGDSILTMNLEEVEDKLYPVRILIRGIDRYHLLNDVVACITEKQCLSIDQLHTTTVDHIVETAVDFSVHSLRELQLAMNSLAAIRNIDEVSRIDIENGHNVQ